MFEVLRVCLRHGMRALLAYSRSLAFVGGFG